MKKFTTPIPFAGSELGETRHGGAFFNRNGEAYRVRPPFINDGFACGGKAIHVVVPDRRRGHLRRLVAAGKQVATVAGRLCS